MKDGTRMRKAALAGATLLAGVAILFGAGCNKLKSRDNMNKGVAAFKNAKYADAVNSFQEAIALDADNPNARVYLAIAYMMQWIPGAESPENAQFASKAREEFNKVLEKDPNDTTSLQYMASLAYNEATSLPPEQKLAKLDEAATWNHKLVTVDPKSRDGFYSLGVIDQNKFYPALMLARVNLKMKPEEPGPLKDKKVKAELAAKYAAIVDDGVQNLQKSLDIDKENDDAMAYMNLLIRERADLADTSEDYKKQIEVADNWLQKALDTKKVKAERNEKKNAGGIVQEAK
jgi:tetratricopeptide (TPR) repeat protein